MSGLKSEGIRQMLTPIVGHPVWGIRQVHGSVTNLEFGKPHLRITEPRNPSPSLSPLLQKRARQRKVYPEGEWQLELYMCAWEVTLDGAVLVHSDSSKQDFAHTAEFDILGRKLEGALIELGSAHSTFAFENGLTISTRPLSAEDEQWNITHEGGSMLALRGDNAFSFYNHKTVLNERVWANVEGASIITVGNLQDR